MKNSMLSAALLVFLCFSNASFAVTGQTLGESANVGVNCPEVLKTPKQQLNEDGYLAMEISLELHSQLQNRDDIGVEELKALGLIPQDSNDSILNLFNPNEFLVLDVPGEDRTHYKQMIFQLKPRKILEASQGHERSYSDPALVRIDLKDHDHEFKVKFLNLEQKLAFILLTDPNIANIAMQGAPGSGKTFLSIYASLKLLHLPDAQKTKQTKIESILVTRRPVEMGREMGFLPGSLEEKMAPYLKPFLKNYHQLMEKKNDNKRPKQVQNNNKDIAIVAGTNLGALDYSFTRGDTLPNAMILVDEAQNMPYAELRTILTRPGEGSKIVVMGDVGQIDDPPGRNHLGLNRENNGLAITRDLFRDEWVTGFIRLKHSVRSEWVIVAERKLEEYRLKLEQQAQK